MASPGNPPRPRSGLPDGHRGMQRKEMGRPLAFRCRRLGPPAVRPYSLAQRTIWVVLCLVVSGAAGHSSQADPAPTPILVAGRENGAAGDCDQGVPAGRAGRCLNGGEDHTVTGSPHLADPDRPLDRHTPPLAAAAWVGRQHPGAGRPGSGRPRPRRPAAGATRPGPSPPPHRRHHQGRRPGTAGPHARPPSGLAAATAAAGSRWPPCPAQRHRRYPTLVLEPPLQPPVGYSIQATHTARARRPGQAPAAGPAVGCWLMRGQIWVQPQ